ncbi:hypothetical protein AVEN_94296-1 [Araneus ventricosus]|uniref:Uncharacterized protein n=1 Tax=Araneus ventricosus TaxID=182803 RepID=A0A4Y2I9U8_ARAVE|nr:hypothetical protein AVEN_94296-1 [Araneus ventricosus]
MAATDCTPAVWHLAWQFLPPFRGHRESIIGAFVIVWHALWDEGIFRISDYLRRSQPPAGLRRRSRSPAGMTFPTLRRAMFHFSQRLM